VRLDGSDIGVVGLGWLCVWFITVRGKKRPKT
jgi:hypothetical protein